MTRRPAVNSVPGKGMGREPLAMMACRKRMQPHALGGLELGPPTYELDPAAFGQAHQAAGHLFDHLRLPAPQARQVDPRGIEGDPHGRGPGGIEDQLGEKQKGLGRNAARVEADAARPGSRVHQGHVQTEIGGAERGGIPAGPAADHQQLRFL
jgi:hypothetical protein